MTALAAPAPAIAGSPQTPPASPPTPQLALADGEYECVVLRVEPAVRPLAGRQRGAARTAQATQGGQPPERHSLAWEFEVDRGPRAGARVRKSAPMTTAEHMSWARRDLGRLGLRPAAPASGAALDEQRSQLSGVAADAEGLRCRVRLTTSGQYRRVYIVARLAASPLRGEVRR